MFARNLFAWLHALTLLTLGGLCMLPANVGTRMVIWQGGIGVVDGADVDQEPDMIPLSGTVTFTPSITHVQNVNASPNPVTISLAPIVGVLDEEGYLCTPVSLTDRTPMYRGVRLIATDDTDLSVKNWHYTVAYRFGMVNSATPSIPAHALAVPLGAPEDAPIDLSKFAPVPSSPPIGTPQALALLAKAEEAATLAATNSAAALEVVARADAGEFTGDPGPAGLDGSNVLPTDEGIAQAITTPASATATALSATIGEHWREATAFPGAVFKDKLSAAVTDAAGAPVRIPAGTYELTGLRFTTDAHLILDDGAVLKHQGSAAHMFYMDPGCNRLTIQGGTIDGQHPLQTIPVSYIINAPALTFGKSINIHHTTYVNTAQAVVFISEFGGYFNMAECHVSGMKEHPGVAGSHTQVVKMSSGQVGQAGLFRFNRNIVKAEIPAVAGANPGGVFFSPKTGDAMGNMSRIEARGNQFYGIGQYLAGNDIAPLHCYPMVGSVTFTDNYFEGCGFSAISAKASDSVVITGNTVMNGQVTTANTATEGAISAVIGHQSAGNPRARVVVANNIVHNPGGRPERKQTAFALMGSVSSPAKHFTVTGNVATECGTALYVSAFSSGTITGNEFDPGTTVDQSDTQRGIDLAHVTGDVLISGNHLNIGASHAIRVSDDATASRITLSGNWIKSSSSGHYLVLVSGVELLHMVGNTLETPGTVLRPLTAVDGTTKIGKLIWDRSNRVLSGATGLSPTNVTNYEVDLLYPYGKPNPTAGGVAGVGATATVTGTGSAGILTLTTGTAPAAGRIVTIQHPNFPLPSIPKSIILSPANPATALLQGWSDTAERTLNSWSIKVPAAPAASTTYVWDYQIIM